jgi:hypothetical protein
MYAKRELKRLGDVKSVLRRRIAQRRLVLLAQTERVAQPLRWVDRVRGWWQQAGPLTHLVAAPVGLWLLRTVFRRRKLARPLIRWGPAIWNIVRGFSRTGSGRAAV